MEMARRWTADGHEVIGTTTSPGRLDEVASVCKEAVLLTGVDAARITETVAGADAVTLAINPRIASAANRRDRTAQYRTALIQSTRNVVAVHQRVLFFSSIAVYGDGGPGDGPIDERSPLTIDLEPTAQIFGAAERVIRESPAGVVLRLPWVSGHARSTGFAELVRLAHQQTGGALPVEPEGLLPAIDYRDAAAAGIFAIEHELVGVFNAVPDAVPAPPAGVALNRTADELGLPRPTFTGELKLPRRPVSSAKLRAAGFAFSFAPTQH
jgi:nucleoside-diphosphate-sugar epimerase